MQNPFSSEEYVQNFAQFIAKCRNEGYYFVPFIGAGLSVPSGIPQAAMLTRYLSWCFLRVMGLNPWAKIVGGTSLEAQKLAVPRDQTLWTPRKGVWPDMAREIRRISERQRLRSEMQSLNNTQMDSILKKAIEILENGESIKDENGNLARITLSAELAREVYGALSDWRTALLLLSRIDHSARDNTGPSVILTAPDRSVVDSFFQFQMDGKQPCQGHRMIAALAPVLRMNVILTPNFDDLIEHAFAAVNSPLKCFEVPHEVPLPDARLVTRQRSIVKLHGGSFGLRADYSIDKEPDFGDGVKFLSYLAGHPLAFSDLKVTNKKCPNRVALMLCGISGKDQRVMALLRLARKYFKNLKIFWFCHSDRDVFSVKSHFGATVVDQGKIRDDAGVITVRHIDYGSLLHQIYQRCTNSIPSAGIQFPASWHMPSAPRIPPPDDPEFEKIGAGLQSAVSKQLISERRRPILVTFYNGARGGATLLSWLFWNCTQFAGEKRSLDTPLYPIWLDLDDVATPAGMFLRLALALARRGGTTNPISSLSLADFYDTKNRDGQKNFLDVLIRAFQDHYARTGECLLICINAQETIGSCSPFKAEPWQASTDACRQAPRLGTENPWFTPQGSADNIKLVVDSLAAMNREPINGVQFVVVARQPVPPDPMTDVFAALTERVNEGHSPFICYPEDVNAEYLRRFSRGLTNFCSPEHVAQEAYDAFIAREPENKWSWLRGPFLHLLMGFRFARFEASLIRITERLALHLRHPGDPLILNTDQLDVQVRDWLNELAKLQALRWKIGGVVWINGAVRNKMLELLCAKSDSNTVLLIESLQARWYGRLLLATSDPLAATEAVFHAFHGVHQWLNNVADSRIEPKDSSLRRLPSIIRHAHGVLNTACTVLEEQLSDQFADHTLVLAQASIEATLDSYQKAQQKIVELGLECPPETEACLKTCHADIVSLRISLYLQEGEFDTLIRSSKNANDDIRKSLRSDGLGFKLALADLDIATARFCFRDYDGCEKEFQKLWQEIVGVDLAIEKSFTASLGCETARHWISNEGRRIDGGPSKLGAGLDERARLVARLCRRHVYLRLLQGMAAWLSPEESSWELRKDARCRHLRQAQWIGDFGMEVLRCIPSTSDRFVFDENVRIRAHCALVRAILGFHERDKNLQKFEFHAALALLSDSEAFIEEFPVCDGKVGRIVVELRRAEILLINTGEGKWLSLLRKQLAKVAKNFKNKDFVARTVSDGEIGHEIDVMRKEKFPDEDLVGQANLQQRIAIVYDAMRYLERCERELRNHPKNRWWWWIYLVLRVHAAEGLFALRLMLPVQEGQKGSNMVAKIIQPSMINFLKYELDGWIKQTALNDIFQLARIVRSYRRLLAAHRLHLIRTKIDNEKIKEADKVYSDVFKKLCQHLCSALQVRIDHADKVTESVLFFVAECLLDAQDMGMLLNVDNRLLEWLKGYRTKLRRE